MEPSAPKVLLVGDFPPPNGGVATHVEVLFRAVRAQGGECHVLDIGKGQLPADGVVPAGSPARFAALLASYAARGFLIHVHTSGANPKSWMLASICAAAGALSGRPPAITFHSGIAPPWLAASAVRRAVAKRVCHGYGTIVAVSEEIRQSLVLCGVDAARIEVLHAFTPAFLTPGAAPEGFAALRAEAAPLFSAMCAPGGIYGEDLLLAAFEQVRAELPRARLALYGIGSAGLTRPSVHGFGQVQRETALAIMAGADVFVRPTLADGDSVSVREALALGRIVIASRVGTRPPDVRLVPPGDVAALAAEMLAVARAPIVTSVAKPEDCLDRLLSLYGFESPAQQPAPARAPEAPCAASRAL